MKSVRRRPSTSTEREREVVLLAATFRALGQIMHLVVDASVPEHARDDEHRIGFG